MEIEVKPGNENRPTTVVLFEQIWLAVNECATVLSAFGEVTTSGSRLRALLLGDHMVHVDYTPDHDQGLS